MIMTRRLLVDIDLTRLGYAPAHRLRALLAEAAHDIHGDGETTVSDQRGVILEKTDVGRQRVSGVWKIETQHYDGE